MAKMAANRQTTSRAAGAKASAAGMGDAAVLAATGKTWAQWVTALNALGAPQLSHKDIAKRVQARFGLSGWWSQMVTVGYEKITGQRTTHQRPDGYSVSASKIIAAPVAEVYAAWLNAGRRVRWLNDPVTIRKATPHKSMRVTWKDGRTILALGFTAKGPDKAQVTLEHPRLKSQAEAARMQAYWRKALDKLRAMLEG